MGSIILRELQISIVGEFAIIYESVLTLDVARCPSWCRLLRRHSRSLLWT